MRRILGQPQAIETLRRSLRSGRMHHAWIFSGPRGVGKFTTAVELARILLDPAARGDGGPEADSETGRLIDAGAHPDLHVVRKELAQYCDDPAVRGRKLLNIPVAVLRQYVVGGEVGETFHDAPAFKTPVLGHGKVFIIDEAELIDPIGQNALLKTLEEPPPRTYLLLVTSRPQGLLPTIHSRCQHARFVPLSEKAMDEWFERSGLGADETQRRWIAWFSGGSPGLAELAVRYGFHRWQTKLDPMLEALEAGEFPAEMGETMAGLIDGFADAWTEQHAGASRDAARKDGARHLLSILAGRARQRLAGAAGGGDGPAPWIRAVELINDAEQQLAANVNLKVALENLVVQWARQPAPQ